MRETEPRAESENTPPPDAPVKSVYISTELYVLIVDFVDTWDSIFLFIILALIWFIFLICHIKISQIKKSY